MLAVATRAGRISPIAFLASSVRVDITASLPDQIAFQRHLEKPSLPIFKLGMSVTILQFIAVVAALGIQHPRAETSGNEIYAKIILETHENVKEGKSLAQTLSQYPRHFPTTFTKMIELAEGTGTLEENLGYLYDFHSDEIEDLTTNMTTLLEPILLILIGLSIAALALTIINPVYQLIGRLHKMTRASP